GFPVHHDRLADDLPRLLALDRHRADLGGLEDVLLRRGPDHDLLDVGDLLCLDTHPLHRRLQLAGVHPPAGDAGNHPITAAPWRGDSLGFATTVIHGCEVDSAL